MHMTEANHLKLHQAI